MSEEDLEKRRSDGEDPMPADAAAALIQRWIAIWKDGQFLGSPVVGIHPAVMVGAANPEAASQRQVLTRSRDRFPASLVWGYSTA
jgi:hypothetical protein